MADNINCNKRGISPQKAKTEEKETTRFLYNGRFSALALLCALPALYYGGEWLYGIATFCLLTVYFVHNAVSDTKSSMVCYIVCVIVMQCGILYSLGSLLWSSFFNIFLLLVYNIYIILTGGLGLLQFEMFRRDESTFCANVEYFLFLLYPQVSVILLVWVCSLFFGAHIAPHLFIVFGFPVFQIFLDPKLKCSFTLNEYILGQPEKLLLMFMFVLNPSLSYFLVNFTNLLHYPFWIALAFSVTVPFFLITFLDTTDLRDLADIRNNEWRIIQILTGCLSLVFGDALLYIHAYINGSDAYFLALVLASTTLLFVSVKYRSQQTVSYVAFTLLAVSYLIWFGSTSWKLVFSMGLNIKMSYASLKLCITLLCIMSIFAVVLSTSARYRPHLNPLLVAYNLLFVMVENVLYETRDYPVYYMVITSILILYLTHRLHQIGYLSEVSTSSCVSLHGAKLACLSVAIQNTSSLSFMACVLGGLLLTYTLTQVLLLQHKRKLEKQTVLVYSGCLVVSMIILSSTLLKLLWIVSTHSEPTIADMIGFISIVTGLMAAKMSFFHTNDTVLRKQTVLVVIFGVLSILTQPHCNITEVVSSLPKLLLRELFYKTWEIIVAEYVILPWLVILSLLTCLVILMDLVSLQKFSIPRLYLISLIIGAPLGLHYSHMVLPYPHVGSSLLSLPYMISGSLAASSLLLRYSEYRPNLKTTIYVIFLLASLVSVVIEVTADLSVTILQAPVPPTVLFHGFLHVVEILRQCYNRGEPLSLDERRKSSLVPNAVYNTSVAFVILSGLLFSPKAYYDIMVFIFCAFLLLFNMDGLGLKQYGSEGTSVYNMITFVATVSLSLYTRALKQLVPAKFTFWITIGCLLEVCFMFGSLTIFMVVILVFWQRHISPFYERYLVFLTPTFTYLLFYGRTSAGRVLGVVGPVIAYYTFYHPFR